MSTLSSKQAAIREHIRSHSPFATDETERIIRKHFTNVPRIARLLVNHHGFGDKRVLDIGSAYGQSLLFWGDGSEGVEIREKMIGFLHALDRKTHSLNVEDGFSGIEQASFDAIFTNNLIEHLVAPHLFLGRLHALLKPNGVLAIGHPLVPLTPFRQLWRSLGYSGWLQEEHVNFFTPQTIKLTLERAGFDVTDQYFSAFSHSRLLSKIAVPFGIHCLSVCRKKEGYRYHEFRLAEFDPAWAKDLSHFR